MAQNDFTIKLNEKEYQQLLSNMSQLADFEKDASIDYGLKEGADVLVAEGKKNIGARVRSKTGNLAKSIGRKLDTRKDNKRIYAGFRRGGNHAHLIDRGTKKRATTKGANRGQVKGNRFWTDAVQTKGKTAMDRVLKAIKEAMEAIMSKR